MLPQFLIANILALSSLSFGLGTDCDGNKQCGTGICKGALESIRGTIQGHFDKNGHDILYEAGR